MKKVILFAIAILFSALIRAQSNKEDIDIIQAAYGKDKKTLVAEFIKLEGQQKTAFWNLYDEYETKRKALGKKRIALIEKYAEEYDKLNDIKIDSLMKAMFSLQAETDQLIVTYYQKMKKPAGYQAAAQFSQIEGYLLSIVRVSLLENIPFFGELYKEKN